MSEGAQDVFPKFKGKNPDELKKSIGVRSHGLRVLAALNSVVENLDDIECLVDMLQHIAHSHHPRGTSRKHFEVNVIHIKGAGVGWREGSSCTIEDHGYI